MKVNISIEINGKLDKGSFYTTNDRVMSALSSSYEMICQLFENNECSLEDNNNPIKIAIKDCSISISEIKNKIKPVFFDESRNIYPEFKSVSVRQGVPDDDSGRC